jgi:hypothetical protein
MASNEPQLARNRSRPLALGAVLLGVALVAVSFLPVLASGRDRWTNDDAREYQETSMQIQTLTHHLGSQTPETASRDKSDEFKHAVDQFQQLRTKLESAQARSAIWPTTLRVVGLVVGLAGIVNFFSTMQKSE